MEQKHDEHIEVYGTENHQRLTGAHETAPITQFTFGVANRGGGTLVHSEGRAAAAVRLPGGPPASNMDPYLVTG